VSKRSHSLCSCGIFSQESFVITNPFPFAI
jgi:hypothetical protein